MSGYNFPIMKICVGVALACTLAVCARKDAAPAPESSTVATANSQKGSDSPTGFGIYYEGAEGLALLEKKPSVVAANPSFLVYLEKLPPVERLRLRFATGVGRQRIYVLESAEADDVFEAPLAAVEGHKDRYRATYTGTLKPGDYTAYYFIDESAGQAKWKKASFQYAGQFAVK